jgi:hypothetical protein
MSKYEVETEIEPGLRYTEETGRLQKSLPVRDCFLWKAGVDEPISGLNLLSFRQRFGALSLPCEGIGGVETLPAFRQQGYMNLLMEKALEGMRERTLVAFVSDAIEDLYEKYGFTTCLAEGYITVPVRNIEGHSLTEAAGGPQLRPFSKDDLPAMVDLYNQAHADRPWTHNRNASWDRLHETRTWRPGSEVIVLEQGDKMAGYAILTEERFGYVISPFVVDELTVKDIVAARMLLGEIASRCWQLRIAEFRVHEPLDSMVGRAAQELGCTYHQTFPPSGGQMGAIFDRPEMLRQLEPELQRRLFADELAEEMHPIAFEALIQGELLPDNATLLKLLLGYWSLDDALTVGIPVPAPYRPLCHLWFPGGGTRALPLPYNHQLDRY